MTQWNILEQKRRSEARTRKGLFKYPQSLEENDWRYLDVHYLTCLLMQSELATA